MNGKKRVVNNIGDSFLNEIRKMNHLHLALFLLKSTGVV